MPPLLTPDDATLREPAKDRHDGRVSRMRRGLAGPGGTEGRRGGVPLSRRTSACDRQVLLRDLWGATGTAYSGPFGEEQQSTPCGPCFVPASLALGQVKI